MAEQAAGAACTYIAQRGGAALGSLAGGALGTALSPGTGTAIGATAGSYLGGAGGSALAAAFCPGQSPGAGQNPLAPHSGSQFTGGQCPVAYSVGVDYAPGGLSGTTADQTASGSFQGPFSNFRVQTSPNGQQWEWFIDSAQQQNIFIGAVFKFEYSQAPTAKPVFRRIDGLPDNCGNNPGYDRVPPVGDVLPVGTDPAAGRDINIDVDFGGVVVPIIGRLQLIGANFEDGALRLNFNLGGLHFNYNPMNGDINLSPGDSPGNGDNNGDGEDDENGEDKEQLSGLFYNVTGIGASQQHSAIGDSTFFYPRFGSVQFVAGDSRSDFLQLNAEKGFVLNPLPQFFDSFIFVPYRPGNTVSFQKHFEKVCCPQNDE